MKRQPLGSYFFKDFQNYRKKVKFGLTKRSLIMYSGLLLASLLCVLIVWFKLPEILVWLIAFLTGVPLIFYGRGQNEDFRDRIKFKYTIQQRAWETNLGEGRKYTKYDFIQKKEVSESDNCGETTSEAPTTDN